MLIEVLNINYLRKKFHNNYIIDGINISLKKGQILGLIGPNGAGKTTTIRCILNLLDIDSGNIEIFGKVMYSDNISIKKRIGVLLENMESLFINLKGEEHLRFVGEIYGLSKEETEDRMNELFDFFDLNDHRSKMIEDYSKGMKKKIALSSALIHNPDFIILDEPFDGLDTLTVVKVKKLIKVLKENGKTILITSHILSYIEDIADEVAIINKGEIVYQSETKDIRNKIKNEVTKETYQSLEEIFIDLTLDNEENDKTLSWL